MMIHPYVCIGMLSDGLKYISFIQFLANALLTSDIFIYMGSNQ